MRRSCRNAASRFVSFGVAVVTVLTAGGLLSAGDAKKENQRIGDAYPLDVCPVSGKKLGAMGDPVVYLHEGRETLT